jgi:hypothetical protein
MSTYKVLRGITYGKKRAESGDIVTDIPEQSVAWLLACNIIEPADAPKPAKKPKSEPVSQPEGDE